MKINYKNTALGLLDDITPYSFTICEDADHSPIEYKRTVGLSVANEFPKAAHLFKNKIQYISDPFYEAYNRGAYKMAKVLDSEPISESGTFISRSSPSETNTIFYSIYSEGKGDSFKINAVIFFFSKETNKDKPTLAIIVQRNDKGFKSYLSDKAAKNGLDEMSVIADIFSLILFLKYCDLEHEKLKERCDKMARELNRCLLSIVVHPDYQPNSEFRDLAESINEALKEGESNTPDPGQGEKEAK